MAINIPDTDTTEDTQATDCWHVVQQPDGHCEIISQTKLAPDRPKSWGPFASRADAIAKRVGLIRAGKCAPQ